jgi:hypothetical protein
MVITTWHPLSAKVGNALADKQRSLGQYSSLADSGQGVVVVVVVLLIIITNSKSNMIV